MFFWWYTETAKELDLAELKIRAENLSEHPMITQQLVQFVKEELESFKEKAKNIEAEDKEGYDHLKFHLQARKDRPALWEVAQIAALVQPSSAAAERVFSKYRNLFNHSQNRLLFDEKRLAVMLAVNERVERMDGTKSWDV